MLLYKTYIKYENFFIYFLINTRKENSSEQKCFMLSYKIKLTFLNALNLKLLCVCLFSNKIIQAQVIIIETFRIVIQK